MSPKGFIALASLIALFAGPALAKDDPIKSALSYPKQVMASTEHDQFDSLIAPGKTGSLALMIKNTKGYKGSMQKVATVITNDPEHTKFLLTLRADFEELK